MIVCHCAVVSSGDVAAALDAGARTVSEVCRRTGAAQNCGTCIFSVKQVVCQHVATGSAVTEEEVRAAS
ncbi:MAG: bacterioferritin-associated ferredoxin [Actinomycetes bacterium]